jgi:hypothetical protein
VTLQIANILRGLGSKTVLFCIGDEYDEVAVHQKRICQQSDLFKNAFQLPKEDFLPFLQRHLGTDTEILQHNGAICLLPGSKFRLQDMTTLVEYLYSATVPDTLSFSDFHLLYLLADTFGVPGLLNKLVDHIQEKHVASGTCFEPKEISTIYTHRNAGDGQL